MSFLRSIIKITFCFIVYLYYTNPEGCVIVENGRIVGLFNKFREPLQQERFWEIQLERYNQKYETNLNPTETMASIMRESDQLSDSLNDVIYKEVGNSEEFKAEILRRQAERIERENSYRKIDEENEMHRIRRVENCERIIPILKIKIQEEKNKWILKLLFSCLIILWQ